MDLNTTAYHTCNVNGCGEAEAEVDGIAWAGVHIQLATRTASRCIVDACVVGAVHQCRHAHLRHLLSTTEGVEGVQDCLIKAIP
jgi:hypothetical protein